MRLDTKHFGELEIEDEKIINFSEGLLGFEDEKRFIIINNQDEESPFQWLQSVKNPDLAFVIINPFIVYPNYDIEIPKRTLKKLEIDNEKNIIIYSIVVVPKDVEKMTTNLLGPVVININKMLGKQVILDDERYSTKHHIFQQKSEDRGE